MKKTILISKQKGKVLNLDAIHKQLDCVLNLSANGEYELSFGKRMSKRTMAQHRLMWGWFALLEEDSGTSRQAWHDYFCSKFRRYEVCVSNRIIEVVGGTRNLNTAEMAEFLTKVQADVASEFGIALPTAEDLYNNFI